METKLSKKQDKVLIGGMHFSIMENGDLDFRSASRIPSNLGKGFEGRIIRMCDGKRYQVRNSGWRRVK